MFKNIKKKYISFIAIIFIIAINFSLIAAPTIVEENSEINIIGESVLLVEPTTNSVIYSKNPNQKMYPASITKLITALVVVDNLQLDDIVTVGDEINNLPAGSSLANLNSGEILTVENALIGLLLPSGNDAACTLATNVIRKLKNSNIEYVEAEKEFANLMNEKAKSLGATNSNFVNPSGLHNDNHYSTAYDLYLIAEAFLQNDILSSIVKMDIFAGDGADRNIYSDKIINQHKWINTNNLLNNQTQSLNYEFATGIKTGSIPEGGKCLAASAKKNDVELIAIILKSNDPGRYTDSITLFEYGFNEFEFATIQKKNNIVDTVSTMNYNINSNSESDNSKIEIPADKDIKLYIKSDKINKITKEIVYNNELNTALENQNPRLKLPLESGQAIGTLYYKVDDEIIYQTDIKSPSNIDIKIQTDYYTNAKKQIIKKKILNIIKIVFIILIILVILILILILIRIQIRKYRRKKRRRKKRNSK